MIEQQRHGQVHSHCLLETRAQLEGHQGVHADLEKPERGI
jgi:hypothetical protein